MAVYGTGSSVCCLLAAVKRSTDACVDDDSGSLRLVMVSSSVT
jgi:hypothetical protein